MIGLTVMNTRFGEVGFYLYRSYIDYDLISLKGLRGGNRTFSNFNEVILRYNNFNMLLLSFEKNVFMSFVNS